MLARLRRAMQRSAQVQELYHRIVAQARLPVFYDRGGVPDTVDGRFEILALHMVAVLRVLKSRDGRVKRFAQELYDFMFYAMDVGLRENSIGDGGVRKQIRRLTESFSGRVVAYERALTQMDPPQNLDPRRLVHQTAFCDPQIPQYSAVLENSFPASQQRLEVLRGVQAQSDDDAQKLDRALRRNLFGTLDDVDFDPSMSAAFAVYFVDLVSELERQGQAAVLAADIVFPVFGGGGDERE